MQSGFDNHFKYIVAIIGISWVAAGAVGVSLLGPPPPPPVAASPTATTAKSLEGPSSTIKSPHIPESQPALEREPESAEPFGSTIKSPEVSEPQPALESEPEPAEQTHKSVYERQNEIIKNAGAREWITTDGRRVMARLLSGTDTQVTLSTVDGEISVIDRAILDSESTTFVSEHLANHRKLVDDAKLFAEGKRRFDSMSKSEKFDAILAGVFRDAPDRRELTNTERGTYKYVDDDVYNEVFGFKTLHGLREFWDGNSEPEPSTVKKLRFGIVPIPVKTKVRILSKHPIGENVFAFKVAPAGGALEDKELFVAQFDLFDDRDAPSLMLDEIEAGSAITSPEAPERSKSPIAAERNLAGDNAFVGQTRYIHGIIVWGVGDFRWYDPLFELPDDPAKIKILMKGYGVKKMPNNAAVKLVERKRHPVSGTWVYRIKLNGSLYWVLADELRDSP